MGYPNKLARSTLSFAGSDSRMLCRAVFLGGGKAENSLRFNSHVPSCGLWSYRTSVFGYEKLDNK